MPLVQTCEGIRSAISVGDAEDLKFNSMHLIYFTFEI